MKYDVVVIGSGLGGLVCGAMLAKAGRSVCVLEKSIRPGGCMQSYTREGWQFDTGLHYVGGLAEGQVLYDIFKELGLLELSWTRMDDAFDLIILNGRCYALAQGYGLFEETLAGRFPHQRKQIHEFTQKLQHITPEDMSVGAWQFLHDCFQDEQLIQVLSATGMRIGLQRESLPFFNLGHALKSYIESSWRLKGNGNQIVRTLTGIITHAGGQVLCKSEVSALHADGGRATGVTCKNGSTYEADCFVADIHPVLLGQLLQGVAGIRKSFLYRLSQQQNTNGILTVSLRLKPDCIPYLNHNIYLYEDTDVWDVPLQGQKVGGLMISSKVPEDGSRFARQIDLLTPVCWEDCLPWADTTVGKRGNGYRLFVEQKAEECLRLAEKAVPGITEAVERKYISSPLTYRDYLGTPEGGAFGIRKDFRFPLQTFLSVKTPLRNIFLTGQNLTLPGVEGVTMTAADTCRHILRNIDSFA